MINNFGTKATRNRPGTLHAPRETFLTRSVKSTPFISVFLSRTLPATRFNVNPCVLTPRKDRSERSLHEDPQARKFCPSDWHWWVIAALVVAVLCLPVVRDGWADQIHRNGFEGNHTSCCAVKEMSGPEEKLHRSPTRHAHQGTNSEQIHIVCPDAKNDPDYARYYYPTERAPLIDD